MKPEQMIQAVRGKAVEIFFHTGYERFVPLDDVEKIILTATEPEDEPKLSDFCRWQKRDIKDLQTSIRDLVKNRKTDNQIALRKWDGFLEDTDYRELPDDMDIVDNLYRNWLQQEDK